MQKNRLVWPLSAERVTILSTVHSWLAALSSRISYSSGSPPRLTSLHARPYRISYSSGNPPRPTSLPAGAKS